MKKIKVILDVDTGVDDATALCHILNDSHFDIKLITVARGNISLNNAVRNTCHLIDIFHKKIPVVAGYQERFSNSTEDATFLHTKEGLGGYHPPKTTITKPLKKDCADAVYEVLKAYPKQITMLMITPHTNLAHLFVKHPDAKDLIKNIVMESGAPNGIKANPNYCSFNIRVDAPAFKYTIDSNLPVVMIPSNIGRDIAFLTEQDVEKIKKLNDTGLFMAKTYETYWEPNYEDRRIACNDLAAIFYMRHPRLFKFKRANIEVNTETGKIIAHYNRNGNFKVAQDLNRKRFIKIMFSHLNQLNGIEIPEIHKPEYAKEHKHETFKSVSAKGKSTAKKKSKSTVKKSTQPKKIENKSINSNKIVNKKTKTESTQKTIKNSKK